MRPFDREVELALARRLVYQAGQILLALRQRVGEDPSARSTKAQGEPVSIADRASNDHLCAGLREHFPEDGIVAEESPDPGQLDRRRVWFVDPLDGTKEYLEGRSDFAVMVGLAEEGTPRLGVVFMPAESRLVWAVGDRGAVETLPDISRGPGAEMIEEVPPPLASRGLAVTARSRPDQVRLIVSRSHRSPLIDAFARDLGIRNELRRGSVGVKVTYLALGEADVYVHPTAGTKLWDTCAPQAILEAAGGRMTDFEGRPLRYDRPLEPGAPPFSRLLNEKGFAASNGPLHELILETMRPHLRESVR